MLIISFEKGNKKFQLDAFKSFLVAQDQDVNNEIIDELGIRETEKITRQAEVQRAISAPLPTVTKGKAPKYTSGQILHLNAIFAMVENRKTVGVSRSLQRRDNKNQHTRKASCLV
jgi:hypothetical protein